MSVRLSTQSNEALVQEHARLVAERARLGAYGRPIEATAVSQKTVKIELELGRGSQVPPAIPNVQNTQLDAPPEEDGPLFGDTFARVFLSGFIVYFGAQLWQDAGESFGDPVLFFIWLTMALSLSTGAVGLVGEKTNGEWRSPILQGVFECLFAGKRDGMSS